MIKKIAIYNLFTFFFSLIHVIFSALCFKTVFPFILKIYVFLLPVNGLFFIVYLFVKNKYKNITSIYILCSIMKLFFSIFIFFCSIIDCNALSNLSLLFKALIHFIFSYFMILFFKVILLLN